MNRSAYSLSPPTLESLFDKGQGYAGQKETQLI
jgi:hypothetical protein